MCKEWSVAWGVGWGRWRVIEGLTVGDCVWGGRRVAEACKLGREQERQLEEAEEVRWGHGS